MSDTFQKALFLDRDGVINIEKDYLYKIEDFEFIDGIFELCRYYQSQGYLIVVITNQSGIVRNFYTENDFNILTTWMVNEFLKNGITISKVYHCPHHPDITGDCICRKPNPGMLLEARHEFNIDLSNSILVGDKERDIEAGLNAGLKQTYLFDTSERVVTSKASCIVSKLKKYMEKKMLILNCGGTFNKRYNALNGELEVPYDNYCVEQILESVGFDYALAGVIYKDSLEMDMNDRKIIASIIMESKEDTFILVHGTDTMHITAEFLSEIFDDRKIIITGAMKPFEIDKVEASLNFGIAIGFVHAKPENGVYICMNGHVQNSKNIVKNRTLGKFELVR